MTAANMANADTPGFRALSMPAFAETFDAAQQPVAMRATRANHMGIGDVATTAMEEFAHAEASPNGNTVSLEQEMINSVEIQREHDRALAIYKHSLDVIRMSIGRR